MDVMDIMMAKAISGGSGGGGGGTGGGDVLPVIVEFDLTQGGTYSTEVAVADVIAADAAGKAVLYIMKMLPLNNHVYALSYRITDSEVSIDFETTTLIHDADGIHEDG